MKQFFKFMFASMLGFLLTFLIIFFFFFILIVSIASMSKKEEVVIKSNTVLHLKFDKEISDRTSSNPFEDLNFMTLKPNKSLGLNDIIKNIKKAKEDENIKGIYIDIVPLNAGMATIEEIREALIDFKSSGKFIISYGEIITQSAYYLASVSDKIYVMPEGIIMLQGLSAQLMFLKGTLEKLEVEPQIIRHGKFKSAIEPFVNDKMSPENREQTMKYITSIWGHLSNNMAEVRHIQAAQIDNIIDSALIRKPIDAYKHKLIDSVIYYDQLLSILKTKMNIAEDKSLTTVTLEKYDKVSEKVKAKRAKEKIAVVYAQGDINSGGGNSKGIYSDDLAKTLREAREDSTIKAVVLRVNSPGGSALASEVILREVILTKASKPIVVSFGDVAASGGYYIACAADKIVSGANTITGSIGVFGMLPNAEKFFNNKLGITFDIAKTHNYSDMGSISRPLRIDERDIIQAQVEDIYHIFISHVAQGRGMTLEQVDSIGQGRVWTGTDALELGLVDEIGGLDKAIEIAAELAMLKEYRIIELPKQKDLLTQILEDFNSNVSERLLKKYLGSHYVHFKTLEKLHTINGVQARLPYEIIIN